MPMPQGVKITELRPLLDEINVYRSALGFPPTTIADFGSAGSQGMRQQLAALRYQYSQQLGGWKGLGLRTGLLKMPVPKQQPAQPLTTQPAQPPSPKPSAEEDDLERRLAGVPLEELALLKEQFAWQKQQALMEWTAKQNEMAQREQGLAWQAQQNRLAALYGGGIGSLRARQTEEFEDWRNKLLAQLTGPANEVSRWFVQHKANPYVPSRTEGLERDIAVWTARAEAGQGTPEGKEAAQQLKELQSEMTSVESEEAEAQRVALAGPPTPPWLPEFVPGTKAGAPLSKMPFVTTPSGQQLTSMLPSQAEFLSGAIDWFGGRPFRDILAEAELMQPFTPQRGRTKWTPPSQWMV